MNILERAETNDTAMEDSCTTFQGKEKKKIDWETTLKRLKQQGEKLGYGKSHYLTCLQRIMSQHDDDLFQTYKEEQDPEKIANNLMAKYKTINKRKIFETQLKTLTRVKGQSIREIMCQADTLTDRILQKCKSPEEKAFRKYQIMLDALKSFSGEENSKELMQALKGSSISGERADIAELIDTIELAERINESSKPTKNQTFLNEGTAETCEIFAVNPDGASNQYSKPRMTYPDRSANHNYGTRSRSKENNDVMDLIQKTNDMHIAGKETNRRQRSRDRSRETSRENRKKYDTRRENSQTRNRANNRQSNSDRDNRQKYENRTDMDRTNNRETSRDRTSRRENWNRDRSRDNWNRDRSRETWNRDRSKGRPIENRDRSRQRPTDDSINRVKRYDETYNNQERTSGPRERLREDSRDRYNNYNRTNRDSRGRSQSRNRYYNDKHPRGQSRERQEYRTRQEPRDSRNYRENYNQRRNTPERYNNWNRDVSRERDRDRNRSRDSREQYRSRYRSQSRDYNKKIVPYNKRNLEGIEYPLLTQMDLTTKFCVKCMNSIEEHYPWDCKLFRYWNNNPCDICYNGQHRPKECRKNPSRVDAFTVMIESAQKLKQVQPTEPYSPF